MEIKYSLSVSHSYSAPPSLLLFTGSPSERRSDLYCSDSRERRGPHVLGNPLSKNAKGTELTFMVPSSASFHGKRGNNRTGFLTKETQPPFFTDYHIPSFDSDP